MECLVVDAKYFRQCLVCLVLCLVCLVLCLVCGEWVDNWLATNNLAHDLCQATKSKNQKAWHRGLKRFGTPAFSTALKLHFSSTTRKYLLNYPTHNCHPNRSIPVYHKVAVPLCLDERRNLPRNLRRTTSKMPLKSEKTSPRSSSASRSRPRSRPGMQLTRLEHLIMRTSLRCRQRPVHPQLRT